MNTKLSSPYFSIVIPAWNEAKHIHKTLESINQQSFTDYELIVVDNNSTDGTSAEAKKYGAIVYLEKQKGVAFARQKGFMEAHGEVIVSTDADTLHPKDWLEKIAKAFKNDSSLVALGGIAYLNSGPKTARFFAKYFYYPFVVIDKIFSGGWNLSGFSLAVRKDAFLKIGGFDTSLHIGEDIDLSKKLRSVGKVVLDKNIIVSVSGRRYKDGFLKGVWDYVPHFFSRIFLGKSPINTFRDVRD